MRSRQKGMGWFGLLMIFLMIAFFAIVAVKSLPVYLNQMKITSSIKKVASETNPGTDQTAVQHALQRHWDIEDITLLKPNDVKVKRTERGRFAVYEYQAIVPLFYNISLMFDFKGAEPLADQNDS